MADSSKKPRGVPLVRAEGARLESGDEFLTPELMARDPRLLRKFKTDRTRRAETVLELGNCLYFYVGHASPRFGDIVFVYDPAMPATWKEGTATRFDTGGVIGYIRAHGLPDIDAEKRDHPEKLSADEKEAFREYVHRASHQLPLGEWQVAFQTFLDKHYKSPREYVREREPGCQCRPAIDDSTGRHHDKRNQRPAWTWEIQVLRDHDIFDGLWLLRMSSEKEQKLKDALEDRTDEHDRWLQVLEDGSLFVSARPDSEAIDVCSQVEQVISSWIE